jgi:uncharacterized protein (DUF305 family)
MAALMTASMVLIEIPLMSSMYTSKKLNAVIIGAGLIALIGSFLLIRQQTLISDRQFLRSMIPHHAGAILMCEEASIKDREIQELCRSIVSGQQAEIDLMKRKLNELGR